MKTLEKVKPAFPFEAYSHVDAADGGGFIFTMKR